MKLLIGINATIAAGATALGALFTLGPQPVLVDVERLPQGRGQTAAIDEAPPAEIFVAMIGRPLFSESREGSGTASGDAEVSGNPRLLGVVLSPGRKLAVFAATDDTIKPAREGEDVWGWRVASIARNSVSLERAGESLKLDLSSAGSKPVSSAVRPGDSTAHEAPVFEPVEELVD